VLEAGVWTALGVAGLGGSSVRSGRSCQPLALQHTSPISGAAADQPSFIGEYDSLYPVA
jgi:hypothetical protein